MDVKQMLLEHINHLNTELSMLQNTLEHRLELYKAKSEALMALAILENGQNNTPNYEMK